MPIATPEVYAEMIDRAKKGGFAYPAINITSSQTLNAALRGFADAGSDGIVQISTGGAEYASGPTIKDKVTGAVALAEYARVVAKNYPVNVALHTDHCQKEKLDSYVNPLIAISQERVDRGEDPLFNSHMWDGSAIEVEENLQIAKELLTRTSKAHIILEIEVGAVGGRDSGSPDGVRLDGARLGVSVTGPVDPATGRLFTPPNTDSNLAGLDLGADLARSTGLDVRVDRDTNVAALGEHAFGAARGVANFVYMTVSTGVGGAVMLDGRLLRGVDGVAGEIGHISVDRVGPSCGCGRRGCLEAIASGPAIARRAGDLAEEGGPLHEILASGRALTGKDVDECAAAGDIAARLVLESAARAVASACVDMANAFNPELIVIGGGVAIAHPQWISRACECVAREALVPANRAGIVVPAQLGDDVSLVGAAFL